MVALLWIFIPFYWLMETSTGPGGLLVGQSAEGAHWIGARRPVLEIVEFSDYQCPYCKRGHTDVRSLVEMVPDKIRLIHRHFPLTGPGQRKELLLLTLQTRPLPPSAVSTRRNLTTSR